MSGINRPTSLVEIDDTEGHMPRIGKPKRQMIERSTRGTLRRSVAALAAVVAVVAMTLGGTAGSADAAVIGGTGKWGPSVPATVTCRYLEVWGQIRTETPAPAIYAHNRTARFGDDVQIVRYQHYYVDATTNRVVATSGWSGWAWARDNVPAAFSGGPSMQSFHWTSKIRVETRIEHYNGTTGAYEGFLAHSAPQYNYHQGYTTYPVVMRDFCLKTYTI